MGPEKRLQTRILNDLAGYGSLVFSFKIIKTSQNGVPDIFFTSIWTGPVFLEIKSASGSPTELQKLVIHRMNKCGAKTLICSTWEQWLDIKKSIGLPAN